MGMCWDFVGKCQIIPEEQSVAKEGEEADGNHCRATDSDH